MPVYMDRHDMPGTTAKAVADAHEKDLKLQSKYGVKLMTYWFDEQRGATFCLMEAPAAERVKELHAEAHGAIPHTIMEVNPELVNAFFRTYRGPHFTVRIPRSVCKFRCGFGISGHHVYGYERLHSYYEPDGRSGGP